MGEKGDKGEKGGGQEERSEKKRKKKEKRLNELRFQVEEGSSAPSSALLPRHVLCRAPHLPHLLVPLGLSLERNHASLQQGLELRHGPLLRSELDPVLVQLLVLPGEDERPHVVVLKLLEEERVGFRKLLDVVLEPLRDVEPVQPRVEVVDDVVAVVVRELGAGAGGQGWRAVACVGVGWGGVGWDGM